MLTHPTFDRLNALGLHGMAKAFVDIEATGEADSLGHAEWLALLLEREASLRHDKRLATRLRHAKLRQQACVEDVAYRPPRGLDRALFASLVEGRWIDDHVNLLICGPAGVGKSWLASALGFIDFFPTNLASIASQIRRALCTMHRAEEVLARHRKETFHSAGHEPNPSFRHCAAPCGRVNKFYPADT
ncbi:hypothetical protein ACVMIH_007800 [Bradyrhizobium sp. USDA 4503]